MFKGNVCTGSAAKDLTRQTECMQVPRKGLQQEISRDDSHGRWDGTKIRTRYEQDRDGIYNAKNYPNQQTRTSKQNSDKTTHVTCSIANTTTRQTRLYRIRPIKVKAE